MNYLPTGTMIGMMKDIAAGRVIMPGRPYVWIGASGIWYLHSIFPVGTPPLAAPGTYIFVRRDSDRKRTALYIGESSDVLTGVTMNARWMPSMLMGFNEIHAHYLLPTESLRQAAVRDLCKRHRPVLS